MRPSLLYDSLSNNYSLGINNIRHGPETKIPGYLQANESIKGCPLSKSERVLTVLLTPRIITAATATLGSST